MLKYLNSKLLNIYFSEQARWIHWAPVGLIFGIGTYFSINSEPEILCYISLVLLGALMTVYIIKNPHQGLISYIVIGFCIGFCIIGIRVQRNETQMFCVVQNNKNINGCVESIENHPYKEDGTCRIILNKITIDEIPYAAKLRLNIPAQFAEKLQIYDQLTLTAMIYPIPMPSSLHGYFARRNAFLQGIGGTITMKNLVSHKQTETKPLTQYRRILTQKLLSNLEKPYGAIAAALVTGDRSYIPHKLRQSFVDAGLAHILAISGLHLSLIAGLIFLLLRRFMCLWPIFFMNFPVKKASACLAIIASMFYMAIANFGIPVQRSFIMIALAMLAVCLDRTAFSMRSLALAAFTILIFSPESLLSASFQLSFAAVLGLLAFYESVWLTLQGKIFQDSNSFLGIKKIFWAFFGIFITTLIASLATTPYSIAFFQRFTAQSILGNLLAIPLVSLLVIPLGLFSVLSLFFNGCVAFFWLWEKSLMLLCMIAKNIALLPGAAIQVKAVPSQALVSFSIGMLWLCLWKKSWRWLGMAPIILGIILWRLFEIPMAYVSPQNDIMAYKNKEIIRVSNTKINTFTTNTWAQEWGISQTQEWSQPHHHFVDQNLFLITSPKEGIEYLHKIIDDGDAIIKTVITFGYERTLKKHGFKFNRIIDRNIIQHEGGIAIYNNPLRFCFLKAFFGLRPWCIAYH